MGPRGKVVGAENVPRKISCRARHSRVSLGLPISLKNPFKWVEIESFGESTIQNLNTQGGFMNTKTIPTYIMKNFLFSI